MIRKKVGQRIKQLRLNLKQSQETCALNAEIDRTYWASVESGKRNISIINLNKMCHALGISLSDFFASTLFESDSNATKNTD